jgi:hypothetical protein
MTNIIEEAKKKHEERRLAEETKAAVKRKADSDKVKRMEKTIWENYMAKPVRD